MTTDHVTSAARPERPGSYRETETKYDAADDAALPPLDGLPGVAAVSGPREQRLEAVYYDTADLRLLRAGITLRQRRGGSDAGWHLKLPEGNSRREIRLPPERAADGVPAELAGLVRAPVRGAALLPVARLSTRSALGAHQDTVIARAAVRGLGISAHLAGENAFSYGLLHAHESRAAEELQRRAGKVWRKAARSGSRRWLR
jgi:hypothetical protein